MALDITGLPGVGGIYSNFSINKRRNIPFAANTQADSFQYTSLNQYVNENAILRMISSNPKIASILNQKQVSLNMKELNLLLQGHAKDTQETARGIMENLPFSLKNNVDEKAVLDAAYLHDIGKVLIPPEILNKTGRLTPEETEIMHKHSELGYELLKTTNINPKTLNLIRNHHQNAKKTGYPFVNKDFKADLNLQIVTIADKFSALTEKRVYKDALTPKQALTIIYRDVQEGKLNPLVFKALVNYTDSQKFAQKTTVAK